MAKTETKRLISVKPATVAMFQGLFAAVLGLGVAILYSMRATVGVASETSSMLAGMAFGLSVGALSLIALPFVYFALGWVVGYVQGWFYNTILGASGGIVIEVQDEK